MAGETVHTLTALGYVVAVLAMAVFVVINYFGIRWFARINNVAVWWKLAHHRPGRGGVLRHRVPRLRTSPATASPPAACTAIFTAIATGGVVFSFLGFRQGVELAGETDNPRRNVPIAVIGSVLITGLIYVLLQIAFIAAVEPSALSKGWAGVSGQLENSAGPLASIATTIGLGWLATLLYIDAVDLARRHRADLHHRHRPDLLRDGQERQRAPGAGQDHPARRAADQPDPDLRRRADRVPAVPQLAAAGRLHHLGDGAVLRLRADRAGRDAPPAARSPPAVQAARRRRASRSWPSTPRT